MRRRNNFRLDVMVFLGVAICFVPRSDAASIAGDPPALYEQRAGIRGLLAPRLLVGADMRLLDKGTFAGAPQPSTFWRRMLAKFSLKNRRGNGIHLRELSPLIENPVVANELREIIASLEAPQREKTIESLITIWYLMKAINKLPHEQRNMQVLQAARLMAEDPTDIYTISKRIAQQCLDASPLVIAMFTPTPVMRSAGGMLDTAV